MTEHTVTFQRNRFTPTLWRATCTCGRDRFGSETHVQEWAASHDLDEWQAATPAEPERVS